MFYDETDFLATLFAPCSVSLRIFLIFRLFINKEITTQYPCITLPLPVQEVEKKGHLKNYFEMASFNYSSPEGQSVS